MKGTWETKLLNCSFAWHYRTWIGALSAHVVNVIIARKVSDLTAYFAAQIAPKIGSRNSELKRSLDAEKLYYCSKCHHGFMRV